MSNFFVNPALEQILEKISSFVSDFNAKFLHVNIFFCIYIYITQTFAYKRFENKRIKEPQIFSFKWFGILKIFAYKQL